MTQRALLIAAATLLLASGASMRAAAQRDTVQRAVPPDTASSTIMQPTSAAAAEAAGVKLLGVFDANTGAWIDRATVRDTLGNQTLTPKIGVAALNALSPVLGYYMFEIRKEGYASRRFRFKADTAAEFLVSLMPNPLGHATALPAVMITDRRRLAEDQGLREGFFGRCQLKGVECVGRKDLDLEPTGKLADLVAKTFGIHRACAGTRCVIQMKPSAGPGSWCTPTYFLNGVEWSPLAGQSQAQLDQFLNSAVLSGIEVYLSEMPRPGKFLGDPASLCGAVVVWTR